MPFPSDNYSDIGENYVNLKEFRNLIRDYSRPYLFLIEMPIIDVDSEKLTAFARSSTLPAYEVSTADIKFQTQTFKVANGMGGSQSWSVEFLCDEIFSLRSKFLAWLAQEYEPVRMLTGSPSSYKTDSAKIVQLDRTGQRVQEYQFIGLFPTKLGDMNVAHDATDYHKFSVDFAYDYFTVESGGNLIDNVASLTGASGGGNLRLGLTGVTVGFEAGDDINSKVGTIANPQPQSTNNDII